MTTIAFDTLAFAEKLRRGGFTDEQAKTVTEAVASATAEQLATKADLKELELALTARMAEQKTEVVRWFLVTAVGSLGLFIAAVKVL